MRLTQIRNLSQLERIRVNRTCEAGQGALASSVVINGFSDVEAMYTIDDVYNATQML
jgi:hypothetical protein